MNKNLFRLSASVILFNAAYSLLNFRNIFYVVDFQNAFQVLTAIVDIAFMILLFATGIGLWKMKKWSSVAVWIVAGLTLVSQLYSMFIIYYHDAPQYFSSFTSIFSPTTSILSLLLGILTRIFPYLIIAIFISREIKQSKINKIEP